MEKTAENPDEDELCMGHVVNTATPSQQKQTNKKQKGKKEKEKQDTHTHTHENENKKKTPTHLFHHYPMRQCFVAREALSWPSRHLTR